MGQRTRDLFVFFVVLYFSYWFSAGIDSACTPLSTGIRNLSSASIMSYKTHKITLEPTFRQRKWFAQQCGYARFASNQVLSDFKTGLTQDNFQSWQTLNINFNTRKRDYDWTRSQGQRAG